MNEIKIIDPVHDNRWDKFVENHPMGWISHLSGWSQVLDECFKHIKGYYLALIEENAIIAALPVFQVKSRLTGHRLVSIPFATLSDPLISTREQMKSLLDYTIGLSNKLCTDYIEIRTLNSSTFIEDSTFGVSRFYKYHYLELEDGLANLQKNFHRTCVRQRISRAMNSNIEIVTGKTETDLTDLYQLYLVSRKRLCLPPQPYSFFKSLWEVFSPDRRVILLLAKKDGQSLAGMILFKFKERVSAEFAVYDERFVNISPIHILFWEAIKLSYNEGCKVFDFGRTSPGNARLMDFKRRWGTTVTDLPIYFYPPEISNKVEMIEHTLKYKIIRNICEKAPQPVFKIVGKVLYNHMG